MRNGTQAVPGKSRSFDCIRSSAARGRPHSAQDDNREMDPYGAAEAVPLRKHDDVKISTQPKDGWMGHPPLRKYDDVKIPTQPKDGWMGHPPLSKTRRCQNPHSTKRWLNGAPGQRKRMNPTQSRRWIEWGTRRRHFVTTGFLRLRSDVRCARTSSLRSG
jgi:hypothetical protein